MSCQQRENGSFNFKKTGYTEVMRDVRKLFQEYEDYSFKVALVIYEALKENKIKKNIPASKLFLRSKMENEINICTGMVSEEDINRHYLKKLGVRCIENNHDFLIDKPCIEMALNEIFRNDNNTRLKPRRSAFPKLTNKDKSFEKTFAPYELFTITANHESNSMGWSVSEGNRSVDNSEYHFMAIAFFKILDNYKWKTGENGHTTCVSENFDDDDCTPDSLAHITREWACKTKKQIRDEAALDKKRRLLRRDTLLSNNYRW